MGVSLFLPTIKGIDEYTRAVINMFTIEKEIIEGKIYAKSINLYFSLPDFQAYP